MNEKFLNNIEKKTNVKKEDILKLASEIQHKDFNNEENLRSLIHEVAKLAKKDVNKEMEDKLINAIKNSNVTKPKL